MVSLHQKQGELEAGFLLLDAVLALVSLTSGFLLAQESSSAQLMRARALHARVVAELTIRNELATRWVH